MFCALVAVLTAVPSTAWAQSKAIATVAGQGVAGATFTTPVGVAADANGNLFVADAGSCVIWKTSNSGTSTLTTTVLAGTPGNCTAGSGTGATQGLAYPIDVASCGGNVYFATHGTDPVLSGLPSVLTGGGSVYMIDASGNLTILPMPTAQTLAASPLFPVALTCDASGDVFLSSYGYRAGTGLYSSVDKIPSGGLPQNIVALSGIAYPGIALDTNGNLFATAVNTAAGWFTTAPVANLGLGSLSQLPAPGTSPGPAPTTGSGSLYNASRLTLDSNANFFIGSASSATGPTAAVFTVNSPPGSIPALVAGNGSAGYGGDGGSATMAQMNSVNGLAFDGCGSLFIADTSNQRIRKVFDPASASAAPCTSGTNGATGSSAAAVTLTATTTQTAGAQTLDFHSDVGIANCNGCAVGGEVYFCANATAAANSTNSIPCSGGAILGVAAITSSGGTAFGLSTGSASLLGYAFAIPGSYSVTAEYFSPPLLPATSAPLEVNSCAGACAGAGGSPIPVSTVPVAFTPGEMFTPFHAGLVPAVDAWGNRFVLDPASGTVTMYDITFKSRVIVSPAVLTTGGIALGTMSNLGDLVFGPDGNLYITDTGNNRVIKVTGLGPGVGATYPLAASVVPAVSTLVPALSPALGSPLGIALVGTTIYVTDSGPTGTTPRVVIFQTSGSNPAILFSSATAGAIALGQLRGITVNPSTLTVYVANAPPAGATTGGNIIQVVSGGTASVLATPGFTLQVPFGLTRDPGNSLYFSDAGTHLVYRMDITGNVIVVAGNGSATEGGDGISAIQTGLNSPGWLALDSANDILIAESDRVRLVNVAVAIATFTAVGQSQTIYISNPVSPLQGSVAIDLTVPFLMGVGAADFTIEPSLSPTQTSCSTTGPTNVFNSCVLVVTLNAASSTATALGGVLSEIQTFLGPFNSSPTVALSQAIILDGTASAGTIPLNITGTPPPGTVGTPYSTLFLVSNASGTPSFSVVGSAGALPQGLLLSTAGVLSGTPTLAGTYPFTVQVTDSKGNAGSHPVTVVINGTTNFSTTTLKSSLNPSLALQPVTFTATVTSSGSTVPFGTVLFEQCPSASPGQVCGVLLGTGPLNSAGVATFTTSALAEGTDYVVANFPGDVNNLSSTSVPPLGQSVGIPGPVSLVISEAIGLTESTGSTSTLPATLAIAEGVGLHDAVTMTPLIGITAPVASYSSGSLGFGTVIAGQSGSQILTVSNIGSGGAALVIGSALISSASTAFAIGAPVCSNGAVVFPLSLNSGDDCQFAISYAAPASGIPPAATLTFTDNSVLSNLLSLLIGGNYQQAIALNGAGATGSGPPPPPTAVELTITESVTLVEPGPAPNGIAASLAVTSFRVTPAQSITVGTASIALVGTISAGGVFPPAGETVSISINGATATALIGASGAFSANIDTSTLPISTTPYTIMYAYNGDANFAGATNTSTTLRVSSAATLPPQIAMAFGVPSIPLNGSTNLTFTISNPNSTAPLPVAFTDSLPAGMVVAFPSNLTNSCGGTLGANPGAPAVTLAGGVSPAAGSCTISVSVTGTSTGTLVNSVTVSSPQTAVGNTTSASLVVQAGLISPAIGTQGETLVVTITGSGFVSGATTVQFGGSTSGITVNSLTVLSAGEILVNISISPTAPTAPSGGGAPVLVTNGTATSQIGVFAVARAALTLSPSSGTQGETLDVTLTGMTFGPGTTVLFGGGASGITVNSVTVVNASVATANITISPTAPLATFNRFGQGGVLVRVTTATSSLTSRFGVYPAALTLSPTTATQGETLDVTLTGMTFGPGTTVQFGVSTSGITLNFLTVVSPSEAIANITISPTAQIANITRTGGGVLVRVNNGTSNLTSRFGVGPATLTLSPDIGTQGETLDVTLTGMTFSPGTTVQFSGSNSGITVNSVTVVSASEAIANITIGRTQPPSIINQFGGGGVAVRVNTATSALTGRFSVGSAALTVSPNVGTQGETLDVTLTGMTFDPSTTVQFLGTNSGITVNSLTVVSASVAVANITISPTAPLAAFLPNGRGGIAVRVNTAAFGLTGRFGVGPETLIVSPASGQKGQTLNVALSGLTFGPGTSVQIGGGNTGITVNSVTVLSASEVIANVSISPTAPVSSAIGRSVQVNTGAFVFNQANAFAVLAP